MNCIYYTDKMPLVMFIVNYIILLLVMFIRLIFKRILSKMQKSIIEIVLTIIYINLFDYKINCIGYKKNI